MVDSKHSTHFLFAWTLAGLFIAAVVLALWPASTAHNGNGRQVTHRGSSMGPVSYADAVRKAAPAVVSIQTSRLVQDRPALLDGLLDQAPPSTVRRNQGSGVIVDDDGHILTNYHVIANAQNILVTLYDGQQLEATVVGSDPDTDLAVITIDLKNGLNTRFGDHRRIMVGDVVLAIGNPFGIGQTVTQGIISATGRDRVGLNTYENFIQTDAAINPGNSGGALINALGEIVGINSAIFSESGNYHGISFAIPIDMAFNVMQQILDHGQVIRGWLGVEGVDLNPQILQRLQLPDVRGVLITDVLPDGPAAKADLKPGDIITEINGDPIRDVRDVLDTIARGKPGDQVRINGIRKQQSFSTLATLDQRPTESR